MVVYVKFGKNDSGMLSTSQDGELSFDGGKGVSPRALNAELAFEANDRLSHWS